jgi:hypothetical protein
MPILVAAFTDGREFLDAFAARNGPAGELAVRTRASPPPGTPIVLEIAWQGLPNRVFARAVVQRRWFGGNLILRLEADELAKRDFLLRMAAQPSCDVAARLHRRFCVRLPLQWRRFGDTTLAAGVAEDLSAGGVLIHTEIAAPTEGEHVAVRLHAEGAAQDLVLTGIVMHVHPRAGGGSAFGVKFEYRSSGEQRTLRSLLRAFAANGVTLVDPTL